MSFRKRSDVIGASPVNRTAGLGGRPTPVPGVPGVPGSVLPSRSSPGPLAARQGLAGSGVGSGIGGRGRPLVDRSSSPVAVDILQNPGVRPSLITSYPTCSTGSSDLDKILLHQGLPLGSSLLVEESGTTDFASIILRVFASQGIIHNRIETGHHNKKEFHSHVIVLGQQTQWANELPGLYKGSSKDQKKANIAANQSKVSVSNLTDKSTEKDLKIAWRYGLNNKHASSEDDVAAQTLTIDTYTHQFDITQRLVPAPASQEISFVPIPLSCDVNMIIQQIQSLVQVQLKQSSTKTIRLVIPNLLNPSIYPPQFSTPTIIIPFIHSLRSVLRKFSKNLVLISSISLDLYSKDSNLIYNLENLSDSVIQLQPFNQEMSQLIEKAYKNEPSKIQHGLVHILKIPHLSERGLMMVHDGEYAFRNGKKKFQIEEWGIPVEDDGDEQQTTKNIDF